MDGGHVELRIQELVLDGIAAGDPTRIAAAVEAELSRLLTDKGVPRALRGGGELPTVHAGEVDLGADAGPEVVGAVVAKALYRGLSR